MKVVFLSFDFGEYSIRLGSAIAQEAEVLLLLPHQLAAPYLSKLDQAVNFKSFERPRYRQPFQQMQMIYRLIRYIKDFKPDVIHIQEGHLWFNLVLPLLKRYPLVVTIHDPVPHIGDKVSQKTPQWIAHYGYNRGDQTIVHAEHIKQIVVDRLCIPDEIVHVIPHIMLGDGVDQEHVQEDEHLILFFGRIWEYKGLEYLIRAEPLITAQVPNAKIMIAGKGEDFSRYRSMMVNPERFIIYNDYIPDRELGKLFQRTSVVALPYIDASQSGVIPLAYTAAKPVVATTVGGLPEMVEHGRTGYLVPPRDEKALAKAIVHLLQNTELRHEFGANGKRKIETECSPNVIARQTLAVYRDAIDGQHSMTRKRKSEIARDSSLHGSEVHLD